MLKSHSKIYSKRHSFVQEIGCSDSVPILKVEPTNFEGRSVNSSHFVMDDPKTRYNGISAVDFALENQQLVGFAGKPCFYEPSRSAIEMQIQKALENGEQTKN